MGTWFFIAASMVIVFFAPLRLRVLALYTGKVQLVLQLRVYGVTIPLRRDRSEQGRVTRARRTPSMRVMRVAAQCVIQSRKLVFRVLRLERLDVRALLSMKSAASTALITGAVSGLISMLPADWRIRTDVTILPDFFTGHSRVQCEWIICAHLGIMMLSAALIGIRIALTLYKEAKREPHTLASTPQ